MSFVQLYSLRRILKLQVDNTFSRPLFLFSWTSLFQLLSVWKHHSEWWHGKDEERKVGAYFEVELIMPISGGPKEKQRSTNCSTMRFDTSIPPVILTSEVRKEIWLYLRFVLPVPSLRITKYQEWPARYQKKKKKSHFSIYPLPICLTQQINSYVTEANRKSLDAITACNITPNNMAPPMAPPYPQRVWFASLLDRIPEIIILA